MDSLKSLAPRVLLWILCVCVPASVGLRLFDPPKMQVIIPTVNPLLEVNLEEEIHSEESEPETMTPGKALSMKIAEEKSVAEQLKDKGLSPEIDKLVAYLSQSHAEQMVTLKKYLEQADILRKQLDAQNKKWEENKGKIEMILAVQKQHDEQFKTLLQKINETDSKVGEKVKGDQANMDKITKMYSTMPAENVAKITEDMDMDSVVEIFSQIKDKDLVKIIQALPPKRAASITLKMADFSRKKK
ncbi:MAG: MotE family protein [Elusimicrobiota bacterium]